MNSKLRVVLVNTGVSCGGIATRRRALLVGLLDSGYDIVDSLPVDGHLVERIDQIQPDIVIVDAESNAGKVIEDVAISVGNKRRPIVLFTDDKTNASIDAAMAAGVSAYVVDGLRAERVKPVLEVALARFRQEQKLLAELSDTKHKLAERKVIERAKGLLMARHSLDEQQAYEKMRSMAMNRKLKLAEIARRIVDADDLLG